MGFEMKKILTFLLASFLALPSLFSQAVLDAEVYKKVSSCVFEVIVEKHDDADIEYESEMDMERIPFAIRKDKYVPIGTAFLLSDGNFYTAAHVINLYGDSVYDKYFIRDKNEKVYEIDQIQKFSERRDFVRFSVKDYKIKEGEGLSVTSDFEINSNVFSVGNALGEGIIIRTGILTSQTYETKNGDWKWIRFSAAASPGNSGGPLINADGTVIGIITMKSENENLNYALPIDEIKTEADNKGYVFKDYQYIIPNLLGYKKPNKFETEINLPLPLDKVHETLTKQYKQNMIDVVNEIKKDYAPNGTKNFVNSKHKNEFLVNSYGESFPICGYMNQNGDWDIATLGDQKTFRLEENGKVVSSTAFNYYFSFVTKPDSVPLEKLVKEPKLVMDYLCKALSFYRNNYGQRVYVNSLGAPEKSEIYKDYFGRTWYVNYYGMDFADCEVLTYSLLLPNGLFVMTCISTKDSVFSSNYLDMAFVADYVFPRYEGKIKEWTEFASLPADIKANLSDLEKSLKVARLDEGLVVENNKMKLLVNNSDMNITDEMKVVFRGGYWLAEENNVCIESRGFFIKTNKDDGGYRSFSVVQIPHPFEDASEQVMQSWNQIVRQVGEYNGEPYNDEQNSSVTRVTYSDEAAKENVENSKYVNILDFWVEGQNKFDELTDFADKLQTNFVEVK